MRDTLALQPWQFLIFINFKFLVLAKYPPWCLVDFFTFLLFNFFLDFESLVMCIVTYGIRGRLIFIVFHVDSKYARTTNQIAIFFFFPNNWKPSFLLFLWVLDSVPLIHLLSSFASKYHFLLNNVALLYVLISSKSSPTIYLIK